MKHLLIFAIIFCGLRSIQANMAIEEILEFMRRIREICEKETNASEELVDGINLGQFPKDPNLMCYTHCVFRNFNMLRKGKINADLAIRQINMFMPESIRDQWVNGVQKCRDAGNDIQDQCEKVFTALECFYNNNDHFVFA